MTHYCWCFAAMLVCVCVCVWGGGGSGHVCASWLYIGVGNGTAGLIWASLYAHKYWPLTTHFRRYCSATAITELLLLLQLAIPLPTLCCYCPCHITDSRVDTATGDAIDYAMMLLLMELLKLCWFCWCHADAMLLLAMPLLTRCCCPCHCWYCADTVSVIADTLLSLYCWHYATDTADAMMPLLVTLLEQCCQRPYTERFCVL